MRYQIIGRFIELHEGLIELDESQASRRGASLTAVGDGLYRINKPVQFKVSEVIGIDYDPPKPLIDFMMPIEEFPEAAKIVELPEETHIEEEKQFKHKGRR